MKDAEFEKRWRRHIALAHDYISAEAVCRPDEYQMRLNALTLSLAEFLLEPYYKALDEEKDEAT